MTELRDREGKFIAQTYLNDQYSHHLLKYLAWMSGVDTQHCYYQRHAKLFFFKMLPSDGAKNTIFHVP